MGKSLSTKPWQFFDEIAQGSTKLAFFMTNLAKNGLILERFLGTSGKKSTENAQFFVAQPISVFLNI